MTASVAAHDIENQRSMMETVLHSFAYGLDFLRAQVAAVEPDDLVSQPNGIANHPAWVIGHLTLTSQLIGQAIGVEPWLPGDWPTRYGTGSMPVAQKDAYEAKPILLEMLGDSQERLAGSVRLLNANQLGAAFPDDSYRDMFPTIRHALTQVLVGHTAYHVGQVGLWRAAMNLPKLDVSFE